MSHTTPASSKAPRIVLWSVGVALVLLAIVAIVLGSRPAPVLDPSTPEGVVQAYARAVFDDDRDEARALLHPEVVEACDDIPFPPTRSSSTRLAIIGSEVEGDEATVNVRITQSFGNAPFGGGESSYEDVFRLEQVNGDWRIRYGPWEFVVCPEVRP